jgi:hypothetical protein
MGLKQATGYAGGHDFTAFMMLFERRAGRYAIV